MNSLFQQTKADPHELYQEIFLHQKSPQNQSMMPKDRKKIIKLILVSVS